MTADRPELQTSTPLQEAEVRDLLTSAGSRSEVPPDDLALIRTAARSEWKRVVADAGGRASRRRISVPLLRAAAVFLALGSLWWWRASSSLVEGEPLATVQRLQGEIRGEGVIGKFPSSSAKLAAGDSLATGALVVTGEAAPSFAALRLKGGASLRLGGGTTVRLVSGSLLELRAGVLYLDSGRVKGGGSPLTVETSFGTAREIGTQFEVRVARDEATGLRVRVREGAVSVERGSASTTVAAGGELTLGRDGRVRIAALEGYGPAWSWVQAAAPGFDIEGAALGVYLEWVARETGLRLRYGDPEVEALAPTVVLHGTIEGMTPAESLDAVLPGSGLAFRIEGGALWVTR